MALSKINGNNIQDVAPGAANDTAKSTKTAKMQAMASYAKATPSKSVKDAANVQISPRAKEMSLARKVAENTPEVNEEKVQKFKNLIAKGQYKPDSGKIADGIAREALMNEYATNQI